MLFNVKNGRNILRILLCFFCETMRKGPLTRTAMARERSEGSWEGIWVHCRTFFADGGDES